MIKDIHTHRFGEHPEEFILSCHPKSGIIPDKAVYLSAGIHPWFIADEDDLVRQEAWLARQAADKRVIAIGEAGLDKRCDTPWSLQIKAFRVVIQTAEEAKKPLIIHCVKSANELISLKKEYNPAMPWIIHGFRGKKELAESLIAHGFYLSFGEHFQEEALRCVPADKLLLETDESLASIELTYSKVSMLRGISSHELQATLGFTAEQLFFGR